ncbi:GntR family transcriptional regulator [Halosquirtibacter xylanolyticus]|uniref:GntR family transcriptional regulator n=1 Tax=Halosquirtibacter xylanolyticus TaxID=3374599 RepID=UPI003748FE8B|nr:GntR family transcriptional regulator [Prolixibacteraceae bacterium]
MQFDNNKPIYLQICDMIEENVIDGVWLPNNRIPSVRQFAVDVEVNPNTIANAFSELVERKVLYNKRGIGYFVSEEARTVIQARMRDEFYQKELDQFFLRMERCAISFEDVVKYYSEYQNKKN